MVAATHRDLEDNIEAGDFREDLFYRLNVFPIEMPSLRERPEDIETLFEFMFNKIQEAGRKVPLLTEKALIALQHYPWPGNVRELGNLVERLSILFPGLTVDYNDLPRKYQVEIPEDAQLIKSVNAPEIITETLVEEGVLELASNSQAEAVVDDQQGVKEDVSAPKETPDSIMTPPNLEKGIDLKSYLVEMEVQLIQKALSQTDGNVSQAAKLLQTNRTTLVEKIRKYELT